jgi:MFS transporter, FSR family, fosmidomycin resistance protein
MRVFARARARRLPLGGDMLVFLLLLLGAGAVGGPARTLLPVYLATDLAWTPPAVAALTSLRLLAGALTAPSGALADTLGARRVLWLGLTGLPIASLAFCTSLPPALVALILVAGLADGWQSTGSQSYLVTRARAGTIGLATSAFFLGSTLGGAAGNLAAGALLGLGGFTAVGLVGLVACLPLLAGVAGLPRDTPTAASRRPSWRQIVAGAGPLLARPTMRDLALLRFATTFAWGTVSLVWPLLLARQGDAPLAALFGAVSLTVAVGAQLITGRLIDAFGPSRPAVLLAILVPLSAAFSALVTGSTPLLFVGGVVGTAVAWSLSGAMPPLLRAAAPPGQAGQAVGLIHLTWSLAMFGGTLLAGWLLPLHGALPFVAVALLNLPSAWVALRLHRELGATSDG